MLWPQDRRSGKYRCLTTILVNYKWQCNNSKLLQATLHTAAYEFIFMAEMVTNTSVNYLLYNIISIMTEWLLLKQQFINDSNEEIGTHVIDFLREESEAVRQFLRAAYTACAMQRSTVSERAAVGLATSMTVRWMRGKNSVRKCFERNTTKKWENKVVGEREDMSS